MAKQKKKKCVLCGKLFTEWGNNPYPLATKGSCCNECDNTRVTPARIAEAGAMSFPAAAATGKAIHEVTTKLKAKLRKH